LVESDNFPNTFSPLANVSIVGLDMSTMESTCVGVPCEDGGGGGGGGSDVSNCFL
jgi:hypothetical protein